VLDGTRRCKKKRCQHLACNAAPLAPPLIRLGLRPIHLLPQGEKGRRASPAPSSFQGAVLSASSCPAFFPSPLAGEGAPKGRMRGAGPSAATKSEARSASCLQRSTPRNTPHPARPSADPPSPARGEGARRRRPRTFVIPGRSPLRFVMPGLEPGIHAGTPRPRGTAGEGRRFLAGGIRRIRGPCPEGPASAIGIGEPDRAGNRGKGRLRRRCGRSHGSPPCLEAAVDRWNRIL